MDKRAKCKKLPKGITQRPDGRYMGRFTYAGERYTLYDSDNPERLRKAMEDMRYELEHGIFGKMDKVTVNKWFDKWLDGKKNKIKETTFILYENYYNWYIEPVIGKRYLKDVKKMHIESVIDKMLEDKKAGNTVKKAYNIMFDMFQYALDNDVILKNPCQTVKLPRFEKKEKRVMTVAEQDVFMNVIKGTHYEDVYIVALGTGMRINEILGLEWQDINFEEDLIYVRHTLAYIQSLDGKEGRLQLQEPKTDAGKRTIPLLPEVKKCLMKHRHEQKIKKMKCRDVWKNYEGLENLVFLTATGAPVRSAYIRKNLDFLVREINKQEQEKAKKENRTAVVFEKITPHTLRHSFATRAIEDDVQPKVVQSVLGHSSLSMTTDLYVHCVEDTKVQEMKKLRLYG